MKKILFALIALFSLASCMQNNGRIGDIFGLWKVESIEINGEIEEEYQGNLFFAFQNDVVAMCERAPYDDYDWRYGQYFKYGDKTIDMYFDMNGQAPLKISHFQLGLNACKILELNSSRFVFSTVIYEREYKYSMKKW